MRSIPVLLLNAAIFCDVLQAQSGGPPSAEPDVAHTVLVVLTTRGLSLSHSQVKPGRVRFLLKNQTPLNTPALLISSLPNGGGPGASVSVEKPANGKKNGRTAFDAILNPGTYALSIRGVPGILGRIGVQP